MGQLTIYNASAGSGKTYTLALEYLKIVLQQPQGALYRQVLAITFTNKATREMKQRILKNLDELARNNADAALVSQLGEALGVDAAELASRARQVLNRILQDYSAFSVSTIDSFYQQVLRSFAREQGLGADFGLQLQASIVLGKAADNLIAKANTGDYRQLTNWLTAFIENRLDEGKNHHIKDQIIALGQELFRESNDTMAFALAQGTDLLDRIQAALKIRAEVSGGQLRQSYNAFLQALDQHGLPLEACNHSISGFLRKLADGPAAPSATALNILRSPDMLFKKPYQLTGRGFHEAGAFATYEAMMEANSNALTAAVTLQQFNEFFYAAGLLANLQQEIKQVLKDENLFLLADTNKFLQTIIGQQTSPLLYEKLGQKFEHFFIDEFQDTSVFQWQNFHPLIVNALGEGASSLIVGDTKQSIYRFRNGDWRLMAWRVPEDEDLGPYIQRKNLQTNWRSAKAVIDFNNAIFEHLPGLYDQRARQLLDDCQNQLSPEEDEAIRELFDRQHQVYETAHQETSPRGAGLPGYVSLEIFEKKKDKNEAREIILSRCIEYIEQLHDAGFTGSDVAILVRNHSEAGMVINAIFQHSHSAEARKEVNYRVVSQESLKLASSAAVNAIIFSLYYLHDSRNTLAAASVLAALAKLKVKAANPDEVAMLTQDIAPFDQICDEEKVRELLPGELFDNRRFLSQLSLYELTERLIQLYDLNQWPEESAFLTGLLNLVHEYEKQALPLIAGFLDFWESDGKNRKVAPGEGLDAIQVHTIHASKGLEFKAVLLPFASWDLNRTASGQFIDIIWADAGKVSPELDGNRFPIKFSSALGNSFYAFEYMREVASRLQDSLNLFYVALTRAEQVLVVMSQLEDENNISRLLAHLAPNLPMLAQDDEAPEGMSVYRIGELPSRHGRREGAEVMGLDGQLSHDWNRHIKIRSRARFFTFDEEGIHQQTSAAINLGEVVHEALANSRNLPQAMTQLENMLQHGLLTAHEMEGVKAQVHQFFAMPQVQEWYGPNYQAVAEKEMATLVDGQVKFWRPDLVLLAADHAVVVDFKTGSHHEKYIEQVTNYKKLIAEASGLPVKGYLLFLKSAQLLEV